MSNMPSDPGASFTTGPSVGPILPQATSEVALGNPTGPAPQTGPLTAYVDAVPQTDQQKAALLSSIAQLGSLGKQTWAQQQDALNNQRMGAIQSINQSTGQAGLSIPAQSAAAAAFAGQGEATQGQMASSGQFQNDLTSAANNWYGNIEAAVPVMQERTAQQVNSYYAAQRMQAQRDASAAAIQQQQLQIALANAQAAQDRTNTAAIGTQTAQANEDAAVARMQATLAKGTTYSTANTTAITDAEKMVGDSLQTYPGFGVGQPGEQAFYGLIAGQPGATKAPSLADVMNQIAAAYASNSPYVAGVDRTTLENAVIAYYNKGTLGAYTQATTGPNILNVGNPSNQPALTALAGQLNSSGQFNSSTAPGGQASSVGVAGPQGALSLSQLAAQLGVGTNVGS